MHRGGMTCHSGVLTVCCKYMHGGAAIGAAGFQGGFGTPGCLCVVAVVVGGGHM